MSERDDIVARLRTDDASDDLLISAASLLETDDDEIERLRAEVALWHQVWDNVALDVPDLRDDNKPLAVAASYELLKREVARLTAERDEAAGQVEHLDMLNHNLRTERDALLARVEAAEKDATRYRWLRGDAPPYSLRWMRWEVRYWNGEYWDDLRTDKLNAALDAAIDAAMEGGK